VAVCKGKNRQLNITETDAVKYQKQISTISGNRILTILQILLDSESLVRYSMHTKTAIETTLLKLIEPDIGVEVDQIIQQLDKLSKQVSGKLPPPDQPDQSDRSVQSGQPGQHPTDTQPIDNPQAFKKKTENFARPEESAAIDPPNTGACERTGGDGIDTPSEKSDRTWNDFLKEIENQFPFMFALLSKGEVNNLQNEVIINLNKCSSFDKKRLGDKRSGLEKKCKTFLNKKLTINILSEHSQVAPQRSDNHKPKQAALNHPLVVEAQKLFNGEIINL
jgi:DNA polymerase-3 subunit gamma/tau